MKQPQRTAGVKNLICDVIVTLPSPRPVNVTELVFAHIASNPAWKQRYDAEVASLGLEVVHQWGGRHLARVLGRRSGRVVTAPNHSLIQSYTELLE